MNRLLRLLGRLGAGVCLALIVPTTAFAFWVFNANQVLLNPNTYRAALHAPFAETQILNAALDGLGSSAPRNALDLIRQLPPSALDQFTAVMFPPTYAGSVVDGVINPLSQWLNGQTDQPQITVDFTLLKDNLTGTAAQTLASALVDNLPGCSSVQMSKLAAFSATRSYTDFPICSPSHQAFAVAGTAIPVPAGKVTPVKPPSITATAIPTAVPTASTTPSAIATTSDSASDPLTSRAPRMVWMAGFTQGLTLIGRALPDKWSFADEATALTPNRPFDGGRLTPDQLDAVRAQIWLQQRLLAVLFLIPVGLLCIVVILMIRTSKQLFRWVGWVLVIGGIVSLLPIILLPALVTDRGTIQPYSGVQLSLDQLAANAFVRGAIESVVSALSFVVLIQVAVLIVIGLVCLILSIIVPPPLNWPPDKLTA